MSERSDRIDAWRALARADPLKGRTSCLLVANQLSRNTNKEEFERSCRLITWQGIDTLVAETGLSETMVRKCLKRLLAIGRIRIAEKGGGRGNSTRYELLLETLHTRAPFPATESPTETLHSEGLNPTLRGPKPYTRVHPNREHRTLKQDNTDTWASAPRLRADALGALDEELRAELGERFVWLDAAKLDGHSADTVTLAVLNSYQADNIRKHCEADILRVADAEKLEFVVQRQPPTARRLP